jgi:hypothetical protein
MIRLFSEEYQQEEEADAAEEVLSGCILIR